jgi:hypothetical protein
VQGQSNLLDELALCLSEVKEIRDGIREALGVAVLGGSDERAQWLQWGAVEEIQGEESTVNGGDERACWTRW